jgi:hypothetical protein
MGHLLFDFKWFYLIWLKKKNPINSEVYGVLSLFDVLKVLEAGIEPRKQGKIKDH